MPMLKKLIFCIVFLVTINASGQNKVVNMTKWNIDCYVNSCLSELQIDSCMIVLQPSDVLIYGEYSGVTIKNTDRVFTIVVYDFISFNEACLTVGHELCHVRQFITGTLHVNQNKQIIFDGKGYKANSTSEYYSAHEVEARIKGLRLFAKYKRKVYSPPVARVF